MIISRIEAKSVLICSDLHLNPDNLVITEAFCAWVIKKCEEENQGDRPQWLLILGDLFDHWIGDDLINSKNQYNFQKVLNQLKKCFISLKSLKVSVGVMHGNRDFLMGSQLLTYIHAKKLAPTVKLVSTNEKNKILLVHGDELCTDDKEHQVFRKLVQTTSWKDQFKSKPIYERKKIAEQLRTKSEEGKLKKTMEIMDVNLDAIDRLLKKNNSHFLIHGHTHRPGKNILPSGNLRWVIPNWIIKKNGTVTGGGIAVKNNKVNLLSTQFPAYSSNL